MSQALICDLCGQTYREKNGDSLEGRIATILNRLPVHEGGVVRFVDACPDCIESYNEWVESRKPADETQESYSTIRSWEERS